MADLKREVSNIMLDYEKSHPQTKEVLAQWKRMELLLRIVAYEAAHGLPTGLEFEDKE